MTESEYNELPTWQKEGMLPCVCRGKTALFYDENEIYRVECCNCKRMTMFRARSMAEAKEHWRTSPNCLGADSFVLPIIPTVEFKGGHRKC